MNVQQFTRKSFNVDAVQITADNMEEVARWCDGDIRIEDDVAYIKVRVHNPINDRQTKAFVTDWVLYAGKGYKVYKDSAFKKSFDTNEFDVTRNAFAVRSDPADVGPTSPTASNPGGTRSV